VTTVLLDLQIDLYWTVARGADPVTYLARAQVGDDRKEQPASRLPDLHPAERLVGGKVHTTQRPLAEVVEGEVESGGLADELGPTCRVVGERGAALADEGPGRLSGDWSKVLEDTEGQRWQRDDVRAATFRNIPGTVQVWARSSTSAQRMLSISLRRVPSRC
jgi:hypothetical protein